jgi:hypothetical protein
VGVVARLLGEQKTSGENRACFELDDVTARGIVHRGLKIAAALHQSYPAGRRRVREISFDVDSREFSWAIKIALSRRLLIECDL